MITIQNYVRVKSVEEAWELNQNKRNVVIGGMLWVRMGSGNFNTAIDLTELGLNTIEETEEEFRIGAMVTLRELELHESINAYCNGCMAEAVKDIVGVQFRNLATVGGSIFGRFGFSDVLTQFMAMDSYVELYKGGVVSLEEFAKMKRDRDILIRVIVKKTPGKFTYQSVRNARTDFPVLTCAVSKIGETYKAVIGARPGKAVAVYDEKNILAAGDAGAREAFGAYVRRQVPVQGNVRAKAPYRAHLAEGLTVRALRKLEEM